MKNCFVIPEHRAIADLVPGHEMGLPGYIITRINVPKASRKQGIGSRLLNAIIDEADRQREHLWLEIQPSDGLNYEELEAWYMRHGFIRSRIIGLYKRKCHL